MTNETLTGDTFVGQNEAIKMLETWRVHTDTQALLFSGPEGVGKRTLAKQVAAGLLCQEAGTSLYACGHCHACVLMEAGTHPDFHHLAVEGKERNIPIDRVRKELIADIGLRPQRGKRKVYLIEADDLQESAQNAILKTLEEPFEYAFILLTVRMASNLLPTTLSRLLDVRLTSYDEAEMRAILAGQGIVDEAILQAILPVAGGIPGTAMTLAQSDWFTELRTVVFSQLANIASVSRASLLTDSVKSLLAFRDQADMLFDLMEAWLRDLLILLMTENRKQLLHKDQEAYYVGAVSRLRNRSRGTDKRAIITVSCQAVYVAIDAVIESRRALVQNTNAEITFTRLLLILYKQLK